MKKTILFLMSFLLLTTLSAEENKVKTYKIKSGHVRYKSTNKREVGTHEIWWDNYGEFVREERNITTTTKFFGKKEVSKVHTIIITKGRMIWSADLEKGTGVLGVNPMYDMVQDNMGDMSESEQEQTANSILKGLGGKKVGKEDFMGYECEVTKMWGSKVWQYKGVILKSESSMMGMKSGEVATSFEPNVSVSATKFNPLADIDYKKQPGLDELLSEMDDRKEIVPLSYSYEKFEANVNKYKPQGYMKMGPMKLQGIYMCSWVRGEQDAIMVSASSTENTEEMDLNELSKLKGIETFSYKGYTCYYGVPETPEDAEREEMEEGVPMLIAIYEQYDMMIMLTVKPQKSKAELLKVFDRFNF